MTDEEAWQSALDDSDNPPLSEEELAEFMAARELPGENPLKNAKACGKGKVRSRRGHGLAWDKRRFKN